MSTKNWHEMMCENALLVLHPRFVHKIDEELRSSSRLPLTTNSDQQSGTKCATRTKDPTNYSCTTTPQLCYKLVEKTQMKYTELGQGCDRQLSLVVKAIAPIQWNWDQAARNVVRFYGVFIEIVSEDFVMIDAAKLGFDIIETSCIVQGRGTEEQAALYDFFDGQTVGRNGALVMIVGGIAQTGAEGVSLRSLRGCSAHAPEKPMILLNARSATEWSLAHEIAHLLARGTPYVKHHPDPNNILHVDSSKLSRSPYMTQKQSDAMRASSFLKNLA